MSSDRSADRAEKREQLQDARNAERGSITKQAKSMVSDLKSDGMSKLPSSGKDALKGAADQAGGKTADAAKGLSKAGSSTPETAKTAGKATKASALKQTGSSEATDAGTGGGESSGTKTGKTPKAKESKGNAITDRSQSAYAVSEDDSTEEKAAASVTSAISRMDKKSKGEQAVDKVEDTAVAKAEQIGKKVGEEGVGGGAGKAAGAAAADATRLGAGAVKAGSKALAQNYVGAVKDGAVAVTKTKTFQKIMAVVVIPGCLFIGIMGLIIVSSLGSTVINMMVSTSEEAQEQADIDVSDDEGDDPDSEENPCRDDNPPDEC